MLALTRRGISGLMRFVTEEERNGNVEMCNILFVISVLNVFERR